jgi:hypothetical protein
MELAARQSRKGQTYSLVAVLITVPLLFYLSYYLATTQEIKSIDIEKTVSDQLHQMEKSTQRDFEKAMEISVKRALLAATSDVIKNGVSISNAEAAIWELVTNGTLYGNATFIMYNNTISEWRQKVIDLNPGYHLNISFYDTDIRSHTGFDVILSARLTTNVSDMLNIARIDKETDKEVFVPIEGTEDPTFPMNTIGYIGRKIQRFPYPYHAIKIATGTLSLGDCTGNVTFNRADPTPAQKILVTNDSSGISGFLGVVSENSAVPTASCYLLGVSGAVQAVNQTITYSGYVELYVDNGTKAVWSLPVKEAAEQGYYSTFPVSGPDIFMRLEDNLTEVPNGFESFVNIPDLQSAGLPVNANRVSVDYIYFLSTEIAGSPVRGLQDWLRLNAAQAAKYNLTELI